MENFNHYWKILEIINKLEYIDEAYFQRNTKGSDLNFKRHRNKHFRGNEELSLEEYQDITNLLTSSSAQPLHKNWDILDIIGYKAQNGKNIKLCKFQDFYLMAVYMGDPIRGVACSCYKILERNFWSKTNPYVVSSKPDDLRYFCDLDGGLEGLKAYDEELIDTSLPEKKLEEYKEKFQHKIHLPKESL